MQNIPIDTIDRPQKAKQLFLNGYNCSQAIIGAFYDLTQYDEKTLMRMMCGFGGGISRLREVCGSFSAAVFIINLLYGYDGVGNGGEKAAHYARVQRYAQKFRELNRYIVCRDILGLGTGASDPTPEARTQEYYKRRPCGDTIYNAAVALCEFIQEEH